MMAARCTDKGPSGPHARRFQLRAAWPPGSLAARLAGRLAAWPPGRWPLAVGRWPLAACSLLEASIVEA
jgi:hypothetical protein